AIARAKARKAQQETESQPVEETASQEPTKDPKKAAVAAAIARAKARKAQQDANKNNTEENE
ncbi:electron transporter RnfC, partial [Vibrio parahaemolyticus]|nr:electron transporter RnfC [Vibrio parahaemolyticus]